MTGLVLERYETPRDPVRALRRCSQWRHSRALKGALYAAPAVPAVRPRNTAALSVTVLVVLLVINVAQIRFLLRGAEE